MRGKQVQPTVKELREYIETLKAKASQGDMQAICTLIDLNKHRIQLTQPEPELTREQELAKNLKVRG